MKIDDGTINEITMKALGEWPSFEAQSWACKVVHAVEDYQKAMLTFAGLRVANDMRQVEWPGSENVDLAFRGLEMAGEAGELANKIKKMVRVQRGISGTTEAREELIAAIRDELADVVVCCDLIAADLGIGLGAAVKAKFNATSEKHGLSTMIR